MNQGFTPIPGAVLKIIVPKNAATNISFTDSDAAANGRPDTDSDYVKTYTFASLDGYNAYPTTFTLNSKTLHGGDTVPVRAVLADAQGNVIAEDSQTLTVKTRPLSTKSYHYCSWPHNTADYVATSNGHAGTRVVGVSSATATTLEQPEKVFYQFAMSTGSSTNNGYDVPERTKIVVTLPAGVTVANLAADTVATQLPGGGTQLTRIIPGSKVSYSSYPTTCNGYCSFLSVTTGSVAELTFDQTVSLNTPHTITVEAIRDVAADGTGGTSLGTTTETVTFVPQVFAKQAAPGVDRTTQLTSVLPRVSGVKSDFQGTLAFKDGHYWSLSTDITDPGFGGLSTFTQKNNGSGVANPIIGGLTSQVTEMAVELQRSNSNKLTFKSLKIDSTFRIASGVTASTDAERTALAANVVKANAAFNANTTLVGVTADGKERVLQTGVTLGQTLTITQATEREFVKLALRFASAVPMNNVSLKVWDYEQLIASEATSLNEDTSTASRPYYTRSTMTIQGQSKAAQKDAYVNIAPLAPKAHQCPYKVTPTTLYSAAGGAALTLKAGPCYNSRQDNGPIPSYTNTRIITLLPPGVEYDTWSSTYQIKPKSVTTIDNFKGTGKTAVIQDYGDMPFNRDAPATLNLKVQSYAERGANTIVSYMTWDNNDIVKPLEYVSPTRLGRFAYADELDLDGDGNTTELFHKVERTFTYVPPEELILSKTVKRAEDDAPFGGSTTADIGDKVTWKLRMFSNYATEGVSRLSILDVLPAVGDHSIVSGSSEAKARGSATTTALTRSLEEVNTDDVNALLTFEYTTATPGTDTSWVANATWLSAAQVTDFSQVTAFRATLREGKSLAPQTGVEILAEAKLANDPALHGVAEENPDAAYNSAAFTPNGTTYTEGNTAKVRVGSYAVTGRYFIDKNDNGVYDADVDGTKADMTATLVDKGGQPVTDTEGHAITATTAADGTYTLLTHHRGSYFVKVTRDDNVTFQPKTGTGSEANTLVQDSGGTTATTSVALLDPSNATVRKNVAVREVAGSVVINKKKSDEAGGGALAGAVFRLTTDKGQAVTDVNGAAVTDVTTNEQGKATFSKVPLGSYTVTEVTAPTGYATAQSQNVTLTTAAPNATVNVVNELSKVSIPVSVTWSDADNQDGKRPETVTVTLKANGQQVGEPITLSADNGWAHTFTGLVEYKDGKKVTYTVEQSTVTDYTTSRSGTTATGLVFTNTHTPEVVSVPVTKVWVDADNQDGIRPEKVTVTLLADGKPTGKMLTLNAAGKWTGAFANLDKYKAGKQIAYKVAESAVPSGYTAEVTGSASGYTITNTHTPEVVSVPVTKVWRDGENQDGIRPASVTVKLLADGAETDQTLTLNAAGSWTGTFANLDKYKAGKQIVYKVAESAVPSGYKAEVTGNASRYTITNTHTPAVRDIPVRIAWVDDNNADSKRPTSVTVTLKDGDGKTVVTKEVTGTSWTATFTGVPKYKNGKEIAYTVEQSAVSNYTTASGGTLADGFTFTNTITGKVSVMVTKAWSGIDADAAPAVTANLLADGDKKGSVTLKGGSWTHTFADLRKYTEQGKKIAYTVTEEGATSGTLTADGHTYQVAVTGTQDGGYTITNTMDNPALTVSGTTAWEDADNQDNIRPEAITVELTRNGKPTGTQVTVTKQSDGSFTFPNLPTYDSKGKPITYGVTPVGTIDGYTTKVTKEKDGTFTVTSTHAVAKTDVPVTLVWDDADNQDGIRPEKVTVTLLADGKPTGKTLELTKGEDGTWAGTFTGLDVNKPGAVGQKVTYSVTQDDVDEYTWALTGDATGYVLTDTHAVAKRSITVTTIWKDDDDAEGRRPEKVTIHLLADGVDTGKFLELTEGEAGIWSATFEDLDVNEPGKQGHKLTYTVSEDTVFAYAEPVIEGSMEDGFTVTNALVRGSATMVFTTPGGTIKVAVKEIPAKADLARTGADMSTGLMGLGLIALGSLVLARRRRRA